MDCEIHGNGAASPAVIGAIKNCRWYERGLLHPFLDYDQPAAYLNSFGGPDGRTRHGQSADPPGAGRRH